MRHYLSFYGLLVLLLIGSTSCATINELFSPPPKNTTSPRSTTPNTRPSTSTTTGNTTTTTQLRQEVVLFALDQQGIRYKYAGRSPRTGFDCSGFTHYVLDNFEVDVTPVSRVQETEGRHINLADAQPGDLIFFRRSRGGDVFHVALVVKHEPGNLTVVHSTSSKGVIMENLYASSYWSEKVMTARDVIGRP